MTTVQRGRKENEGMKGGKIGRKGIRTADRDGGPGEVR